MTALRDISESDWFATDQSGLDKLPPPGLGVLRAMQGPILMRAVEGGTWVSDRSSALWSVAAVRNLLPIQLYQTIAYAEFTAWATPLLVDESRLLLRDLLNYRPDLTASIGDFPGEPYQILSPIPITLEWTGDEYLARFDEANIAMTGPTQSEALGNVAEDILDTYELYLAEQANLGPEPAKQLAVLRRYIAQR